VTERQIANLFVRWNDALQKSTPEKPDAVVNLYATDAILLPTVENGPYTNHAEIGKYFEHFLKNKPSARSIRAKFGSAATWPLTPGSIPSRSLNARNRLSPGPEMRGLREGSLHLRL
jgi:hypothetical protein